MTTDILKLLKSIHAEIVRSNDMREALSPVDSATLAMRIEQIKNRREKAERHQEQLESAAAAIAADEKGSLAFPSESSASNIKASSVLANSAAGSVAADVLPQNAKETADDQPANGPFPTSGPGPDVRSARAVLVVAYALTSAVDVAGEWSGSSGRQTNSIIVATKETRDKYTKDVRSDPHAFFNLAGNGLLFIVGDMDMRPESWMPAFDVIAVVNGDTYALLKGRRAAAPITAAPIVAAPTAVVTHAKVDHAEKPFPAVSRILKSSLPYISQHKAVMFYGPDLKLTKFLVDCIVYHRGLPTIPVEFATRLDREVWDKKSVGDTDPYRRRAIETGYQVHVIVGWDMPVVGDSVDKGVRVHSDDNGVVQWSLVENGVVVDGELEVGPA